MKSAIRVDRQNLRCPYCRKIFSIKGNVVPAIVPRGSGGCKAYSTCSYCEKESCANSDQPEYTFDPPMY